MLTFKLNNEMTNIQQTICYVRKISDFSVAKIIFKNLKPKRVQEVSKEATLELQRTKLKKR